MLNLMADLESLALHDNAVIVQIGLIAFNGNFEEVTSLNLKVDVTQSLLDGFEVDPKTARGFWSKQPQAVKQSVLFDGPRLSPKDAAYSIVKWVREVFKGDDFGIWANGILFDINKIDSFLSRYGLKKLTDYTRYNLVYDYRTLRAACKQLYPEYYAHAEEILGEPTLAHDAISDCRYQIAMLSAMMAILGGQYAKVEVPKDSKLQVPEPPPSADIGEPSWDDEEQDQPSDPFIDHVLKSPPKTEPAKMLAEAAQEVKHQQFK